MQKLLVSVILFLLITNKSSAQTEYLSPVQTVTEVLQPQNFGTYYYSLKFWKEFLPLDTAGHTITKAAFLQKLATGHYLPLRMDVSDTLCYRLYHCDTSESNMASIHALGYQQQHFYQMEGKPLPGFNYSAIDGSKCNTHNTKGKIVVWKCWFIHCGACVAEMPALNNFVDANKQRKDLVFISVATDSAYLLKQFITKHPFKYAIAPVNESYLVNTLGITEFPTHIVLNREGLVVKVLQDYKDMEEVVNGM